ncbi:hypothetical protein L345_00635, partial [Ophiophagus hannah]
MREVQLSPPASRADEDKRTVSHFIYLSFDGSIALFQAHQLTSACNLDVYTFPFDEQKCNITMVPSLFRENEVKLKNTKTFKNTNQDSRKHYLAGGEWKFQKVEIIEVTEIEAHEKYSTVIYQIFMKRRSILHELIVILPMFILFLLDMAISYAFASPAEKIAYKVTMILQVSFLSVMLIDKLPPTSDYPPVIAMFFIGIFAFMVLGILENACMEYFREQNLKLPSFKNFTRKFLRKEKIKAEDSVTDIGEEIDMENKPTREFPLVEHDNADSLVFLKQVTLELQQIRKHLALEEGKEVSGPALQDKYVRLEKCLCYTRLILSLGFIAFIVISKRPILSWSSESPALQLENAENWSSAFGNICFASQGETMLESKCLSLEAPSKNPDPRHNETRSITGKKVAEESRLTCRDCCKTSDPPKGRRAPHLQPPRELHRRKRLPEPKTDREQRAQS